MIDTKIIIVNGKEYRFFNTSGNSRNGFYHESELQVDGHFICSKKNQYYNRTWEKYTYQSVMEGIIYTLIEGQKEILKEEVKGRMNKKVMTKAAKVEWEKAIKNSEEIGELVEVLNQLQ